MIAFLALRPRRPSVVAAEIGLSRAATSRQLHLLQDAGLVEVRRPYHDRRSRMYAIDLQARGRIIAWLAGTEIGRPTVPEVDEPKRPDDPPPTANLGPPPEARAPIDYDDPAALDDLLDS